MGSSRRGNLSRMAVLVIVYSSVSWYAKSQVSVPPPPGSVPPPQPPLCECECAFFDKLQQWETKAAAEALLNKSKGEKEEELLTEVKATQQKLSVNTTALSSTTRKKISAKDERTSAVGLGYLGAVFLGLVFVSIVACDMISIKQHIHTARTGEFVRVKKYRNK